MRHCIRGLRAAPWTGRVLALLLGVMVAAAGRCEAPAAANAAFNGYVGKVESRLAEEHRSVNGFMASTVLDEGKDARLRRGEFIVEQLTPATEALPGALLHDWRGTAFVHGATVEDFERLMKNFSGYTERFAPQVMRAGIVGPRDGRSADHFTASMRVRQRHVITVVLDTTYDVTFGRLDARHGYSISRSTHVSEIGSPGTSKERSLSDGEEHGFLWRLNTYWSYEERDGGLYLQIESVSLTRAIPTGLGWVVRPYVESVPRESLEFTLRAACNGLRK